MLGLFGRGWGYFGMRVKTGKPTELTSNRETARYMTLAQEYLISRTDQPISDLWTLMLNLFHFQVYDKQIPTTPPHGSFQGKKIFNGKKFLMEIILLCPMDKE